MPQPLLEVEDVTVRFGGLAALSGVSLSVAAGEIVGLIGPNGAGKTTLFHVVTGLVRPTRGVVRFRGRPITRRAPFQISRLGIARTFQLVRILPTLTVAQNVLVGLYFGGRRRAPGSPAAEARRLLGLVGLGARADEPAQALPLADRKRVEIARALATQPELLLLDEVLSGIRAAEARGLMELIREIRGGGTTVIMIEHIMKAIMALSDRVAVLHHGEKIAEGTPETVAAHPAVVEAYLGAARA
ncbi:MAG: ABC transporter ATP-binding protein [Candidatus Rokubacteria bacterium]|nr:ABC transporter ATP-binding protein [Candidatus Rokubacteria bacterium]